jgi:hypothetical protein
MFVNGSELNEQSYREPSIWTSGVRGKSTNQKQELPVVAMLLTDRN